MSKKTENTGFTCNNCGSEVVRLSNGSYRNHCPFCLHSSHVDENPGDRASDCGGDMEPVGVEYNAAKGYQLIHKCRKCGALRKNMVAENTEQPDDFGLILKIMSQPE